MTTLVTFGDSWPQGGELNYPDVPYGELLSNMLQFDYYYNYGTAGASLEHMIEQLIDFKNKNKNNVTAVFFLTNPARSIYWPKGMSWSWQSNERQHWPDDALDTVKELFLHFHEYDNTRANTTVCLLQNMCKHLGYNDYYFSGWVRYKDWLPGVNTSKIWKAGKETAADWFGASDHNGEHLLNVADNQYIRPNFAHPNQLGHELIAKKLAKWIKH
jgi:hypothetical protein